jgi:hypothetical protein
MGGAARPRAASAASGAGRPEPRADRAWEGADRREIGAAWRSSGAAWRSSGAAWRERLRHAVDLAVAFATLRDVPEPGSAHEPVDRVHPHRTPLRPPTRPRRPGAAVPRPQHCVTPTSGTDPRPPRPRLRELG